MSNKENANNGASDLTDVGVFWKKVNKAGKTFLSGKVKIGTAEYTAFVFTNNKSKPNQPDYRLTLSELDEELKPPTQQKPQNDLPKGDNENQDDIPF
jgi:uncharacterized protein (DUF736 family)